MKDIINKASKILVATDQYASLDDTCAAVNLAKALKVSGKEALLLLPEDKYTNKVLNLFPTLDIKLIGKKNLENFIVSIKKNDAVIENVRWREEKGKIEIHVTTKTGDLSQENLEIKPNYGLFDLVILVNVRSLKDIGEYYTNYPKTFSKETLLQIGHIKTDLAAFKFPKNLESSSALVAQFIDQLGLKIDSNIATDLLAGILWTTEGFSTTDGELIQISNYLYTKQAKPEKAAEKAYKNLDINNLRLAKTVLDRLEIREKIAFAKIAKQDSQGYDLDSIIGHCFSAIQKLSKIDTVYIFIETPSLTHVFLLSNTSENVFEIAKDYKDISRGTNRSIHFKTEKSADELFNEFIEDKKSSLAPEDLAQGPLSPAENLPKPIELEEAEHEESSKSKGGLTPAPPINPLPPAQD